MAQFFLKMETNTRARPEFMHNYTGIQSQVYMSNMFGLPESDKFRCLEVNILDVLLKPAVFCALTTIVYSINFVQ